MGTPITIWSLVPAQLESQLAKVDGVVRKDHPTDEPVFASQGKYVSAKVGCVPVAAAKLATPAALFVPA
jgi:hypothetical protein